MEKNSNILKYDKGFKFNIGTFLVLIIILYLLFHVFSSFTKKEVVAYEVALGSIVEKNFYQGMALRSEVIVTGDREGDIYYYQNNKKRVGVKSPIYAIDTTGAVISKMKSDTDYSGSVLSDDLKNIYPKVESYVGNFEGVRFFNTYSFKSDMSDELNDIVTKDVRNNYSEEISRAIGSGSYYEYYANAPGFLVYTIDGYEDKDLSNFTANDFNAGGIITDNLRLKGSVNVGDNVYKLITSEDWQIVIPIDSDKASQLQYQDVFKVRFTQDDTITYATGSVMDKEDGSYLVLSFDDSMERYASQRFINVELLLDEKKGLKIPNSAICEKDFFVIPKSFFYLGGNTNELGVMLKRGGNEDEFVIPNIYYENEDSYYIDNDIIKAGDKLKMENSSESYTVGGNIDSLTGVYNINKGYAIFKTIDVLYRNEEYAIVKNAVGYSISLYDHIVLDADNVKENDII